MRHLQTINALLGLLELKGPWEDCVFKLAAVLAFPSNLVLMTKDAELKCGPDMLLYPLAIRAKKVA
jgi:hypothetical protein